MFFTKQEQRIIIRAVDILYGCVSSLPFRKGLTADSQDRISLLYLKTCTEELASHCTTEILEMDESDSKYRPLVAYTSIHAKILLKIEVALANPNLCNLGFFNHPLWD